MLRVITSNRAISLLTVASDIAKVANAVGIPAQLYGKIVHAYEVRSKGDQVVVLMPVDPLFAVPYILLARDLGRGGVPYVFYGVVEGKLNLNYVRGWMREVGFVAASRYVGDKLLEAGLRVRGVVHHGVDLEVVGQVLRSFSGTSSYVVEHGLDPSKHVVVTTVSSSHPRKGLAWLARVAEEVGRRDPSVRFLVVTDEDGVDHFKGLANAVATADFGRLPRSTILHIIASSHVLASPSLAEGFGLPVLEAMALGVPAVHAALPPLMEFSTGWAVPVREVVYFDRGKAGLSGIIYEHHLYDVREFAEVLLQVADIVRRGGEGVDDYIERSYRAVVEHSAQLRYSELLRMLGLDVQPPQPPAGYTLDLLRRRRPRPGVPAPATPEGGAPKRSGRGIPFKLIKYPGGDWFIRKDLLDLISKAPCTAFVEVFGGSGLMSALVPRSKFKVIVYNDKDSLLVNLFTVVKERPGDLKRVLASMPVSHELFTKYSNMIRSGEIAKLDPVERAAATFYVYNLSFFGLTTKFAVDTRDSVASYLSRKIERLEELSKLWADVVIENRDFRDVIRVYDRKHTLFYCDPPYLDLGKKGRGTYYTLSFTEGDMRDLLGILSKIKGRFVLKLPADHLGFGFIRTWLESGGYGVVEVEHPLAMQKRIGEKRERFKTLLIYNYKVE